MVSRTPEEVFAHHGQALGAEDLEDIVADYAEDAVLVVQKKVYRGKDGLGRSSPSCSATSLRRSGSSRRCLPTTCSTWSGKRPGGSQGRGRHRHVHLPGRHDPRADGRLQSPAGLSFLAVPRRREIRPAAAHDLPKGVGVDSEPTLTESV